MDLLLNPNIAYLILVVGFLVAVLAMVASGTGVLEIITLFLLLLAGYSIYNLPVNAWALALLVLAVVPFLATVRPGRAGTTAEKSAVVGRRLLLLGLSIVLAVVGSAFLFRGDTWEPVVHPLLALVVSVGMIGYLWLVAHKSLEAFQRRPEHSLETLIGAVGESRTPVYSEGSVYVGGEMWSARSANPIPSDSAVRVVRREGFVLEVEPLSPPQS